MKYCTQCGAQLRDDSAFCTTCGTRMKTDAESKANPGYPVPVAAESIASPEPPLRSPKKKLNIMLAIGIPAAIVVILVIVLITRQSAGRMILGTWVNERNHGSTMTFDRNGYLYDSYGLPSAYSIQNGTLTILRPLALGSSATETYKIRFSKGKLILLLDDYETVWVKPGSTQAQSTVPAANVQATRITAVETTEAAAMPTPVEIATPVSIGTPISNATPTPEPDPTPVLALLPNGDADPEDFYFDLDSRYIDASELTGFTQEQVTYIRNSIYAMCGKFFTTEKFIDYFYSKDWYAPYGSPSDDIEARMNDYQETNLWTIVDYETSMGWR